MIVESTPTGLIEGVALRWILVRSTTTSFFVMVSKLLKPGELNVVWNLMKGATLSPFYKLWVAILEEQLTDFCATM